MDNKDREDRGQEEVVLRLTEQYVEAVQAGHRPDISDYVARYPQYADAIANFIAYYQAVELPLAQLAGSSDCVDTTINREDRGNPGNPGVFADTFPIAVESAWHRVLSQEGVSESGDVGEIDHISEIGEHGEVEEMIYGQTIQSLFMAAKQQRLSPSQLAVYLDISEDIVMLLEQRALLPESIPLELYRRLAKTLHQPMRTVQNYFGMGRQRQVAEHPVVYDPGDTGDARQSTQKVSFREALDKSGKLLAEQKSSWHEVLLNEAL